jgi:putative phage-type endonuclease
MADLTLTKPKPKDARILTQKQIKQQRVKYLGGTDVAAIMGINPFKTPVDVALEKWGLVEVAELPVMRLGHWCEGHIAQWFEKDQSVQLQRVSTKRHITYRFLAGNLDRKLVGQAKGTEIKTFGHRAAAYWGEPWTDQVPKNYHIQALWYAMLYDLECVYVVAMNKETGEIFIYVVERDPGLEQIMLEYAVRFWREYIKRNVRPPLDYSDRAAVLVGELYPNDNGGTAYADDRINDLVRQLEELVEWEDVIEREIKGLKTQIKDYIGENSALVTAIGDFTWKKPRDSVKVEAKYVIQGTLKLLEKNPRLLKRFKHLLELNTHTVENSRRLLAPWSRKERAH